MEATACYGGITEKGKLRSHDVLHPGRFGSAPLHEPEHLSVGINGRKSTSLTDATSPWMVAVSKREGTTLRRKTQVVASAPKQANQMRVKSRLTSLP